MATIEIGPAEHAARRNKVISALKGAAGLVLAGDGAPPLVGRWHANRDFVYLTGIDAEPGAAVLFDPANPSPKRRCVLFLKPLNPEMDDWDGRRPRISAELRERYAFDSVMRLTALPRMLTDAIRRSKRGAMLHPFAVYDAPVSADLALIRKVMERIPGVALEDRTQVLPSLRAVKSRAELSLMKHAIDATEHGLRALARALEPGVTEQSLQITLEAGFREAGAETTAFNTIVGSGANATVLHYTSNDGVAGDGELVVIDSGASYRGYAADVTRTLPVNGKFTRRQRDLYTIVLNAQKAAIGAIKPGATMVDVDEASRRIIEKAGLGDRYIHGIGHQLGLDVHDSTPDGPLKAGMVVTIEPGVYIQEEATGIRIEDDVLVTPKGHRNLSASIPKSIEEVEAMVRGR